MGKETCTGSANGQHGGEDSRGRCGWCGVKIFPALGAPKKLSQPTNLDQEYRRHYDPDFGEREEDV